MIIPYLKDVNGVGGTDLKGDVQLRLWVFYDLICHFKKMHCVLLNMLNLDNKIGSEFQEETFLLLKKSVYYKVYKKGTHV